MMTARQSEAMEVIEVYFTFNTRSEVTDYERYWYNASPSKNPWWVVIKINGRVVRW